MLPSVVPNARIMRYGYESQWFGADAIRQKASTVASRFLLALKRERKVRMMKSPHLTYLPSLMQASAKEFPFRPLIFVAHCFGGLVVLKVCGNWEDLITFG